MAMYPEKISAWCAIYTQDDLKVLEYRYNLKNYYRFHYNISRQMTQPLMADLSQKLSSLKYSIFFTLDKFLNDVIFKKTSTKYS